jgi:hypothetical protein
LLTLIEDLDRKALTPFDLTRALGDRCLETPILGWSSALRVLTFSGYVTTDGDLVAGITLKGIEKIASIHRWQGIGISPTSAPLSNRRIQLELLRASLSKNRGSKETKLRELGSAGWREWLDRLLTVNGELNDEGQSIRKALEADCRDASKASGRRFILDQVATLEDRETAPADIHEQLTQILDAPPVLYWPSAVGDLSYSKALEVHQNQIVGSAKRLRLRRHLYT